METFPAGNIPAEPPRAGKDRGIRFFAFANAAGLLRIG